MGSTSDVLGCGFGEEPEYEVEVYIEKRARHALERWRTYVRPVERRTPARKAETVAVSMMAVS